MKLEYKDDMRILTKFAWFPTVVKILNDEKSKTVFIWFSSYFELQKFEFVKDFEWSWVTSLKYLHQI